MNLENEALVRRWHEEGVNQQQPDLALELCSENFQFHFAFITPDYPKGAAALRHWLIATFEFFPNFSIEINDLVSDGVKLHFARLSRRLKQEGYLVSSQVERSWPGARWVLYGAKKSKMEEFWWMPDLFTLIDQLQLVPD